MQKIFREKWFVIFGLLLLVSFSSPLIAPAAGWVFYWDGSYHGRVIDTNSKKPIEGAVVVVVYAVECYGVVQSNEEEIGVQEVLTQADGGFLVPSFWAITTPDCFTSTTRFHVFKPGYVSYPAYFFKMDGLRSNLFTPAYANLKSDMTDWISEMKKFRSGVLVQMPPVRSQEEMKEYYPSTYVSSDSLRKKMENYFRLENELRKMLGYKD